MPSKELKETILLYIPAIYQTREDPGEPCWRCEFNFSLDTDLDKEDKEDFINGLKEYLSNYFDCKTFTAEEWEIECKCEY